MRAIWVTRHGGGEVLEVRQTPDPEPGPGEVRVLTRAVGLNFAEVMARRATYPDAPRPPCVLGYEGAGVSLVLARQTTFGAARKAYLCSTPTVENDSEIHEWFLRGDQRYFHVPCPRCGEYQPLEWRDPAT